MSWTEAFSSSLHSRKSSWDMIKTPLILYFWGIKCKKSANFEGLFMSWAYHIWFLIGERFDINIGDGFDIRVKLFLRGYIFSSIVSEGTLKISYPFVILTTSVVPTICCGWQSFLFSCEIWYIFFYYLVRSCFERCFEGNTNGCCFQTVFSKKYLFDL